ncbi:MAG: hypothetical protein MZW92_44780 [Comamonadaceae bacterium]|nr:hypothetical protein [Comamonadaceae bacterium]
MKLLNDAHRAGAQRAGDHGHAGRVGQRQVWLIGFGDAGARLRGARPDLPRSARGEPPQAARRVGRCPCHVPAQGRHLAVEAVAQAADGVRAAPSPSTRVGLDPSPARGWTSPRPDDDRLDARALSDLPLSASRRSDGRSDRNSSSSCSTRSGRAGARAPRPRRPATTRC